MVARSSRHCFRPDRPSDAGPWRGLRGSRLATRCSARAASAIASFTSSARQRRHSRDGASSSRIDHLRAAHRSFASRQSPATIGLDVQQLPPIKRSRHGAMSSMILRPQKPGIDRRADDDQGIAVGRRAGHAANEMRPPSLMRWTIGSRSGRWIEWSCPTASPGLTPCLQCRRTARTCRDPRPRQSQPPARPGSG